MYNISIEKSTAISDITNISSKLICEIFRDKFTVIFGRLDKCVDVLSRFMNLNYIHVAYNNVTGEVVGFVCLKYRGDSWIKIRVVDIIKYCVRNMFTCLRSLFLGSILDANPDEDELLIDLIGVIPRHRGKGIGSSLIKYVVELARNMGFRKIGLYVVENNWKAIKLYERLGFRRVKEINLYYPWSKRFCFRKLLKMEYSLHDQHRKGYIE